MSCEIIEWLGQLIRAVDSSLIDEWEALSNPDGAVMESDESGAERAFGAAEDGSVSITANPHFFHQQIRNELFKRVDRFALDDLDSLTDFADSDGIETWSEARWENVLDRYYAEYDWLGAGPEARSKARYSWMISPQDADLASAGVTDRLIEANAGLLQAGNILVTYTFEDEQGDCDWRLLALVDAELSADENKPVFRLLDVGPR